MNSLWLTVVCSGFALVSSIASLAIIYPNAPRIVFFVFWTLWSIYTCIVASGLSLISCFGMCPKNFSRLVLSIALTTCSGVSVAFWFMILFLKEALIQATARQEDTPVWLMHWHHTVPFLFLSVLALMSRFGPGKEPATAISPLKSVFPASMGVCALYLATLLSLRSIGKLSWWPYPLFDMANSTSWGWVALVAIYSTLTFVLSLITSFLLGGTKNIVIEKKQK